MPPFIDKQGQKPPGSNAPWSNAPFGQTTLPVSDRESMYSVYYVVDRTWYRSDVLKKHKERHNATKTVV